MKIIYYIILVFLFSGINLSYAQDGVLKFKKIELSFSHTNLKDSLLNLELYQNGIYNSSDKMGYRSESHYDNESNVYTLNYSFSGIGGRSDNRLGCPILLVKIDLLTKDNIRYSQVFFIELAICSNSQIREIKLLNIDLNELVTQPDKMILVNENEKYEIVPQKEIKIDKLVKIE